LGFRLQRAISRGKNNNKTHFIVDVPQKSTHPYPSPLGLSVEVPDGFLCTVSALALSRALAEKPPLHPSASCSSQVGEVVLCNSLSRKLRGHVSLALWGALVLGVQPGMSLTFQPPFRLAAPRCGGQEPGLLPPGPPLAC